LPPYLESLFNETLQFRLPLRQSDVASCDTGSSDMPAATVTHIGIYDGPRVLSYGAARSIARSRLKRATSSRSQQATWT
jgi:hypothetical protein